MSRLERVLDLTIATVFQNASKKRKDFRMEQKRPLWVSSRAARDLLGVSFSTLYRLRKAGQIEARQMNPQAKCPRWLYRYSDLEGIEQ